MTSEETATVTLVFLGARLNSKGLTYQFKKRLTDGTLETGVRSYASMKGLGRPGSVLRFECVKGDDGTIYPSRYTYMKMWKDDDDIVEWQAAHEAAQATDRVRKRFKRETSVNRVLECLDPIRDAYTRARGLERQVILAQAVSYITRSK